MPSVSQRLLAEAIGAFALVFAGCGAIMVDAKTHALGHLGVALSFGLVIMVMISALGHISGAHFNPAVTLGFALGRTSRCDVAPYWAAQLAGAVGAAFVLRGSLGTIGGTRRHDACGERLPGIPLGGRTDGVPCDRDPGRGYGYARPGPARCHRDRRDDRADALFGGPITGASMNPARSLAPAIAGGPTDALWVYLTAPLVGAALSVLAYTYLARSPARWTRSPNRLTAIDAGATVRLHRSLSIQEVARMQRRDSIVPQPCRCW